MNKYSNRWYVGKEVEQIDLKTIKKVLASYSNYNKEKRAQFKSKDAKPPLKVGGRTLYGLDKPINTKQKYKYIYFPPAGKGDPKSAWFKDKTYYHVVTKMTFEKLQVLTKNGKVDLTKIFDDAKMVETIKKKAAILVSNHLTNIGEKITLDPANYLSALIKNTILTTKFHLSTGAKEAGSLVSFQVVIAYGKEEEKKAEEAKKAVAAGLKEPEQVKKHKAYEFMSPENKDNELSIVEKALLVCHKQNLKLEKKYDLDFSRVSRELKILQKELSEKFYGPPVPNLSTQYTRRTLWLYWGKGTGKKEEAINKLFKQTHDERELIELSFSFPTENETEVDSILGFLEPLSAEQEAEEKKPVPIKKVTKVVTTTSAGTTTATGPTFSGTEYGTFNLSSISTLGSTYASNNFAFHKPFDMVLYFHGNGGYASALVKPKSTTPISKIDTVANGILVAVDPIGNNTARKTPKKWKVPGNLVESFLQSVSEKTNVNYNILYNNVRLHVYGFSGGGGAVANYILNMNDAMKNKVVHVQFNDAVYSWYSKAVKATEKVGPEKVLFNYMKKLGPKTKFTSINAKKMKKKFPAMTIAPQPGGHYYNRGLVSTNKFLGAAGVTAGSPGAPPPTAVTTAQAKTEGFVWDKNAVVIASSTQINDSYRGETKYLLLKSSDIHEYITVVGKEDNIDIHKFVEKFIKPSPELLPKGALSKKVYNDGEIEYKTAKEVNQERISAKQKRKIHNTVLNTYNQVGDAAFLKIIRDSHLIKTKEDVYDNIINSIPIDAIIQTAADCLMKDMREDVNKLKAKVCNTILKHLSNDDLDKILKHMNTSADEQAKILYKKISDPAGWKSSANTVDESGSFTGAFKGEMKQRMQSIWEDDVLGDTRDLICFIVLAAIPAAIALLYNFDMAKDLAGEEYKKAKDLVGEEYKKLLKKGEKQLKEQKNKYEKTYNQKIINPAKDLFVAMEKEFAKYEILSLTTDWPDLLKNSILDFIEEFVVQLIKNIIDEIAYMCEGSSESDFVSLKDPTPGLLPKGMEPTYPFEPLFIEDVITDPTVYDDLQDFIDNDDINDIDPNLIDDFLSALSDLLTLSELCSLLGYGGNEINIDYIINKVWSGLLSLDKFLPLKKSLKTRNRLKQLFQLLSKKISKAACIEKIQNLEHTKKLLSDICGPSSNEALISDLKLKATDGAIEDFLNQQEAITDNLLDAIYTIKNLKDKVPPIFCGPESQNNDNPPMFESQRDPSTKYLNDKVLKNILEGITLSFEQDISSYKSLLSGDGAMGGIPNTLIASSEKILGALSKTYNLKLETKGGTEIKETADGELEKMVESNKFIASKVYKVLTNTNSGIDLTTSDVSQSPNNTAEAYIQLSVDDTISGDSTINLKMNLGEKEINEVPPQTSRLEYITNSSKSTPKRIDNPSTPVDTNTVLTDMIKVPEPTSFDDIIYEKIVSGTGFYGLILEQIVKEHAEFISTQDLFERSTFEKLILEKKDICDVSILGFERILDETIENVKLLECRVPTGAVPSAYEIVKINAYIELAIKIVIIQEYLKNLMVFSAFGIESLIPPSEGMKDSFYYKYMLEQIFRKLSDKVKTEVDRYSRVVYAARNNKNLDETSIEETLLQIIRKHSGDIQMEITKKLEDAGISTPAMEQELQFISATSPKLSEVDIEGYFDEDEDLTPAEIEELKSEVTKIEEELQFELLQKKKDPQGSPYYQILKNISLEKTLAPPPVLDVNHKLNYFTVPKGFYSQHDRLKNGGFFIEDGLEVHHKYEGDEGVFSEEDWKILSKILKEAGIDADVREGEWFGDIALHPTKMSQLAKTLWGSFNVLTSESSEGEVSDYTRGAWQTPISEVWSPEGIRRLSTREGRLPISDSYDELLTLSTKHKLENPKYIGIPGLDIPQTYKSGEYKKYINMNQIKDAFGYSAAFPGDGIAGIENFGAAPKWASEWMDEVTAGDNNKFFKRFSFYKTLNLLIPVWRIGSSLQKKYLDTINTSIDTQTEAWTNFIKAKSNSGFREAVLDRKYFLIEEDTNNLYFKLPLITLYGQNDSEDSLTYATKAAPSLGTVGMVASAAYNHWWNTFWADWYVTAFKRISEDSRFKYFADSIQYKELLSFISIMVSETLEEQYPQLGSLFDGTLNSVEEALNINLNSANRNNDPNFYQKSFATIDNLEFDKVNLNFVTMFLKALIKASANMVDPTWVTPWFWPGPLQPIGIIAKLMDLDYDLSNPGDKDDPDCAPKCNPSDNAMQAIAKKAQFNEENKCS